MKAIIIAAGQGSRLRPHTSFQPKCMVEIQGRSLIERQVESFRQSGIDDIIVIRGYRGKQIQIPGVRYIDNVHFKDNNILESLFYARDELVGDVIMSYGDIMYHTDIVKALVQKTAPCMLVVDLDWKKVYEGRDDHPVEQAELCVIDELLYEGTAPGVVYRVAEVGKHVGEDRGIGEFIGLAKFSAASIARMIAHYEKARLQGTDQPYQQASTLRQAYLTDLINASIQSGEFVHPLWIKGGWREIDTVQDYERAQAEVTW